MRSEKYSLSSKGHFTHLNHIPAVKSKPVWDPRLRLSTSVGILSKGHLYTHFIQISHTNLLYINSLLILNSDILFCRHSNDKPFSPTRHSPFILTISVYHNASFKKKKDKNNINKNRNNMFFGKSGRQPGCWSVPSASGQYHLHLKFFILH